MKKNQQKSKNISVIDEVFLACSNLETPELVKQFFKEIFTKSELEDVEKRWKILQMLNSKETQRTIAKDLSVSLCKVTRGAKILKDRKSLLRKLISND